MGNGKKTYLFFILLMLFCLGWVSPALAHRVTVFAWVEDGTVFTESKLGGGKRVREGDIRVYDENDTLLLKGKTDDNGEFSFPLPETLPLTVELNAGMGHLARWTLTPEDAGLAASDENGDEGGQQPVTESAMPAVPAAKPASQVVTADEMAATIERSVNRAVEQAVDKKIDPMMRMLRDTVQQGPSFSDIMGGLGYILGLVGLVAYFKGRDRKPSNGA